jgi:putative intracellular protease/amidase
MSKKAGAPRIAMVMTSQDRWGDTTTPGGAWYSEVAIPYFVFLDSGCAVRLYSIKGGAAPIDPASREDAWVTPETKRMDGDSAAQAALQATRPVSELVAGDFDALFIPGGVSTMWDLPGAESLTRLIEATARAGDKVVATLCHGACALTQARATDGEALIKGRALTSFTDSEERAVGADEAVPFLLETRLRSLGCEFRGGADWSDTVVRDGWLVSGQNPQSAMRTATTTLAALASLALSRVSI